MYKKNSYGKNAASNVATFVNNAAAGVLNQGVSLANSVLGMTQSSPGEIGNELKAEVTNTVTATKQLVNAPLSQHVEGVKNTYTNVNFWENAAGLPL